jgi:hypothetical protein
VASTWLFWLMEELLASAVVPSGVGCDTVLLVGGRGIVTLVLHPLLFELHERGPLAGSYGPHTAWLLTVTVEVGVNVVAVLDLVVAVHVAFAPVLDERAVAVRVEEHRQQEVVRAVQGEQEFADITGLGHPLYGFFDPLGSLLTRLPELSPSTGNQSSPESYAADRNWIRPAGRV